MGTQRIAVINTASIGCDKNAALKLGQDSDLKLYLYRASGIVTRLERGESNTGEYIALEGYFEATNHQSGSANDGKTFCSDTLFLPPGAQEDLVNKVLELGIEWDRPNKKTDKLAGYIKNGDGLAFGRDIYVHRDKSPMGIAFLTREIFSSPVSTMAMVNAEIAKIEQAAKEKSEAKGGKK